MSSRRTFLQASRGVVAVAFCGLASQALAHAHLKSATPPAGGVVAAAPSEIDLTFSEGLNLKFSGAEIVGPDKTKIPTGAATLGASDTSLIVPVTGPLRPGTYILSWHALSTDGHKTKGSYTFTIKP